MTDTKRNERTSPAEPLAGSDSRSARRRFAPALKDVTEGGSVFGVLVANERAKQGLTQEELAERIHTSPSTVARIEQGHPPGAELREQLTDTLYPDPPGRSVRRFAPSGAMRRVGTRATPADRARTLRLPRRSRWLWGVLAAAAVILIGVIVGSQISGAGSDAPSGQPSVAVSNAIGAPAAIHSARVQAQKEAAAEARRAAEKAREREQAAAAAAAAAAARKAKKAANQSAPAASEPVTEPVAPSPSPAPSGGGGGDSSGPAPGLQHGIGNGG
jgi:transcriptional regulator with XRE-family HTH domain